MNWRQALRMPAPLSRRKSAMVLKSGAKAPAQPHQLDVALRLALQAPAGLDAVQVAVDVNLEQYRRVVGRTARVRRRGTCEAKHLEIEFCHEGVDDPNRVVLANEVIQTFGQQRDLLPVFAFDESLHAATLARCVTRVYRGKEFSHSLGRKQTS